MLTLSKYSFGMITVGAKNLIVVRLCHYIPIPLVSTSLLSVLALTAVDVVDLKH